MTLERWTAFVGVLLVVVFTPGPDFAVVLRHALAGSARGVRAAAGNVTGLAAHTAAAALGLSALLAARPDVLTDPHRRGRLPGVAGRAGAAFRVHP
jgi:threonine/homoserine/homoserine lactone efflux protein